VKSSSRVDGFGVALTGAEPLYPDEIWNQIQPWMPEIKRINNCYAYAVDNPVPWPERGTIPGQPGLVFTSHAGFAGGRPLIAPATKAAEITVDRIKVRAEADG